MNTPVKFELAKLLEEQGYPFEFITVGELKEVPLNIPTIAEVVMWLYEKHGIWICVSITIQKEYYYQCIDITGKKDSTKNNYPSRICKPGNYFNSPTEAYEAAINYTLNNLT